MRERKSVPVIPLQMLSLLCANIYLVVVLPHSFLMSTSAEQSGLCLFGKMCPLSFCLLLQLFSVRRFTTLIQHGSEVCVELSCVLVVLVALLFYVLPLLCCAVLCCAVLCCAMPG